MVALLLFPCVLLITWYYFGANRLFVYLAQSYVVYLLYAIGVLKQTDDVITEKTAERLEIMLKDWLFVILCTTGTLVALYLEHRFFSLDHHQEEEEENNEIQHQS